MNLLKALTIGIVVVVAVGMLGLVVLTPRDIAAKTTVNEQGSDTMLQLMTAEAQAFNNQSQNTTVQVADGGSGVGITALINKQIPIAQSSRDMTPAEIKQAKAAGVNPVVFNVSIDGIAILVHKGNPANNMTLNQLQGIYNGTYTNWNQINASWPNMPISAFGRESTSGTYEFMQSRVLQGENYSKQVSQETGNQQIASKVEQTQGGIGYVGVGYARQASASGQATAIFVKNDTKTPGYLPTDDTAIYNGSYALWRYLHVISAGQPTGGVQEWVGFVLSPQGQTIVNQTGFYSLPPKVNAEMNAKLNGTTSSSAAK